MTPLPSEVSQREATKQAEREMGRPVKCLRFNRAEIGPHVVQIFYYSMEYPEHPELGTQYRFDVYVNGKRTTGGTVGN